MAKRALLVLALASAVLIFGTDAGAQGDLAVSVDAGPHAPGTEVDITVSGASSGSFVVVRQCDVTQTVCGPAAFIEGAATGDDTIQLRLHRKIANHQGIVDCGLDPCVVEAVVYDEEQQSATAPVAIDPAVIISPPTVTSDAADPLPDRASIQMTGSGYDPDQQLVLSQCSWLRQLTCPVTSGYAYVDNTGSWTTEVAVRRTLGDVDCAAAAANCAIWVFPEGHLDQLAAVALTFDGSTPPVAPSVIVTPDTELLDGQVVSITGADFGPDEWVNVEQCALVDITNERCRYLTSGPADATGGFALDQAVARRVNVEDCAVVDCVVRVNQFPFDEAEAPIAFDAAVPPPPIPEVSVSPSTGLVDRQIVEIRVADAGTDSFMSLTLCTEGDDIRCGWYVSTPVDQGDSVVELSLPRLIDDADCAVVGCALRVDLYGDAEFFFFELPVAFDPDAPFAEGSMLRSVPATGLWDRQRVEVRGSQLDPGAYVGIRQCADSEADSCATSVTSATVDARGELRASVVVRRVLDLPAGPVDCAATTCHLVIDTQIPAAVALSFDPEGPIRGSDLPPQLECVAWPTAGWPVGDIPEGVDADAVAALGDQMVEFASSVVVIHGGQLVYENYAEGFSSDSIFPSFSVSKSFTSTVVGLLWDDGLVELDERVPFDEWADADDPRRAITPRHILNMSSGLEWLETYSGSESDVIKMVVSADPSAYVKAKPLEWEPGSQFRYSTGDTQLLGSLIGQVAAVNGDSYVAFLHERLFDPLGINPVVPGIDRAGVWGSGWFTNTTTRNFAKLGLLYLRDGVWEDDQFLSSEWVDFVRAPSPASSGYGGQFWLDGDGSFRMVGLNGQAVHIVPELDLVVAVNNGGGTSGMVNLFRDAAAASCGGARAALVDDEARVQALGTVDIDVLANDDGGDVGLAPTTLTISDAPTHGTATVTDGGIVEYSSGSGFTGEDSFAYVACTTDRRRCDEASVRVHVEPLPFRFTWPIRQEGNRRVPGLPQLVSFRTGPDLSVVDSIQVTAIDCDTGDALGEPEPVDVALHRGWSPGAAWFVWATDRGWTGCHRLEVLLTDGTAHGVAFAWRTPLRR